MAESERQYLVPRQPLPIHGRSQSEVVGTGAQKMFIYQNLLRATSVNCLYEAAGQDSEDDMVSYYLSGLTRGRPRSWTWHGFDSEDHNGKGRGERKSQDNSDKGVFSLEEGLNKVSAAVPPRRTVSLNAYSSQENILDDTGATAATEGNAKSKNTDHEIEKQAIKDIISDVLVTEFLNGRYDENVAVDQCALVSQRIQSAVRQMLDANIKVVATVHTGEQKGQAVEISCQCLWDPERDNLVTVSFQDQALFAICTVFIVHMIRDV
eukprot:gene7893-8747_t